MLLKDGFDFGRPFGLIDFYLLQSSLIIGLIHCGLLFFFFFFF